MGGGEIIDGKASVYLPSFREFSSVLSFTLRVSVVNLGEPYSKR